MEELGTLELKLEKKAPATLAAVKPSLFKFLKSLNVNLTPEGGFGFSAAIDLGLKLDLRDQDGRDNLLAVADYLRTIAPAFAGKPVDQAAVTSTSDKLATRFAEKANIGVTVVRVAEVKGTFEITMGDGITFGVKAEAGLSSEKLWAALYRNQTNSVSSSVSCRAEGQGELTGIAPTSAYTRS